VRSYRLRGEIVGAAFQLCCLDDPFASGELNFFRTIHLTRVGNLIGYEVRLRFGRSNNFNKPNLQETRMGRLHCLNMQKERSKRYRAAAEKVDSKRKYPLGEAIKTLKTLPPTKFDQTVTISFKLGVDPKQSDQMVRGTCPLPHGSGKTVRVLVFASGPAAEAAREAGAEFVGYEDLVKKVTGGFSDFDVAIATPAAMAEVKKLGKVLGPRGLMPNPKAGTVTDDTAKAVREVKAGRVEFKLDKNANVSVPVGKFSFGDEALAQNGQAVIDAVVKARPATAKGSFVEAITLAATMSPGVSVDPAPFLKS
jgi:large subunit ribosomal protein L1